MRLKHAKLGKIALAAFVVFFIGAIGLVSIGFDAFSASPATSKMSDQVALENATSVKADIDMGVGELEVQSGSTELMEGKFVYGKNQKKPTVQYEVSDRHGNLDISNKEKSFSFLDFDWLNFGDDHVEWNIRLNEGIPMDLRISTGVGKSQLNLRNLNLNSLVIDTGVGDSTIDLSGNWDKSFDVKIDTGVGDTELIIPKDIGVRIHADTGIGSLKFTGLTMMEDYYINDAYNTSDVKINIDLDMGVGDVDVDREDLS